MDSNVTIKMEIGTTGQRFAQQIQLHNSKIEEEVMAGINDALELVCSGDNLRKLAKQKAEEQIHSFVSKAVLSWEVQGKITKMIEDAIGEKLKEHANKIAEKVVSGL